MQFSWNLIDTKSRQVSRIQLSILAHLNNAIVLMVPLVFLCLRPPVLESMRELQLVILSL